MTQKLAADVLNSLSAHIAVLDAHGCIVDVNEAWKRFARENGGQDPAFYVGASYLAACEDAGRRDGDPSAQATLQGMRELLRGDSDGFSVEYPCHSPTVQRWFVVRITRFIHKGATYLAAVHEDITTRKLAETALRISETTLSKVLRALPVGVWVMNQQGRIIHGNPAGQRIWCGARYVGPEDFGEYKGWWLDSGRRIEPDEWAAARAIQKGETSLDEEVRIECFDGTSKIILNSAIPLHDEEGRITGAIIVNQDVTSRKRMEQQLLEANTTIDAINRELQELLVREQLKARTDALTGLWNRRHFFEVSQQLFAVAHRYRTPLSLFLFDVDHFKQINDTLGHQTGDAILQRVAGIAREHTRDADVLARYGGEEFIAILPNTSAQEAYAVAEHIREKIAACRELADDHEIQVTISAGIAEILADDDALDRLIRRADEALYLAKHRGRNRSQMHATSP